MSSSVCLLDANILIALATPDHTAHARAVRWFGSAPRFATCPITQGALIRFHLRLAVKPSMAKAKQLLTRISALPTHEFWNDDLDYRHVPDKGIIGYKQVTDANLIALAAAHGGSLATMDEALAAIHPHAVLI